MSTQGKLKYDIEFEAKGLDQVKADADRLKKDVAAGGSAAGTAGGSGATGQAGQAGALEQLKTRLAQERRLVEDNQRELRALRQRAEDGGGDGTDTRFREAIERARRLKEEVSAFRRERDAAAAVQARVGGQADAGQALLKFAGFGGEVGRLGQLQKAAEGLNVAMGSGLQGAAAIGLGAIATGAAVAVVGITSINNSLENLREGLIESRRVAEQNSLKGAFAGEDLRKDVRGLETDKGRDALVKRLERELALEKSQLNAMADKMNGGSLLTRGADGFARLGRLALTGNPDSDERKEYDQRFANYRAKESSLRAAKGLDFDMGDQKALAAKDDRRAAFATVMTDGDTEAKLRALKARIAEVGEEREKALGGRARSIIDQDVEAFDRFRAQVNATGAELDGLRRQQRDLQEGVSAKGLRWERPDRDAMQRLNLGVGKTEKSVVGDMAASLETRSLAVQERALKVLESIERKTGADTGYDD